jgi:hypothetical protein
MQSQLDAILSSTFFVKGKKFKSIKSACVYYGLVYSAVYYRLNHGWSKEEAFNLVERFNKYSKFKFKSKVFDSFTALCRHYKMNPATVRHRMGKNWSLEEALGLSKRTTNSKCEGKIYIIRNIVNNKVYIGLTSSSLVSRLAEHKSKATNGSLTKLHKAMRKRGINNFYIKLLKRVSCRHDLIKEEIKYINKFKSIEKGYNTSKGGGNTGNRHGINVEYESKKFISIVSLANYLGIDKTTLGYRLRKNIPLNQKLHSKGLKCKVS